MADFKNGGYITTPQPYTAITYSTPLAETTVKINQIQRGLMDLTNISNKTFFALACLVLGLDTPELRAKFAGYFNQINSDWSEEFVYDWLIQSAYKVKYGDDIN